MPKRAEEVTAGIRGGGEHQGEPRMGPRPAQLLLDGQVAPHRDQGGPQAFLQVWVMLGSLGGGIQGARLLLLSFCLSQRKGA